MESRSWRDVVSGASTLGRLRGCTAALVSIDGANPTAARLGFGVVAVVPVTTNVDRVYAFQVVLAADDTGLDRDSKAQAEQVRSTSVERAWRDNVAGLAS